MKRRRITLSIALALSIVLVALMSSDSRVEAQNQMNIVADTGAVTLGPNQILRLTMFAKYRDGDADHDGGFIGRFRLFSYTQGTCDGDGVCKHMIASQTTSDPITLMPGEAASIDIPNAAFGVRGVILSNHRNARVTFQIIDITTGKIVSILDESYDVGNGDPI